MTTEQKIREAFEKWNRSRPEAVTKYEMDAFFAGYIALLNELVPQGEWNTFQNGLDIELRRTTVYTLPEGVKKP